MYKECIHVTMKQTVLSFRATPRTTEKIKELITKSNLSRSECLRIAVDTYVQDKGMHEFLKDAQEIKKKDWWEIEEFQRKTYLEEDDMFS